MDRGCGVWRSGGNSGGGVSFGPVITTNATGGSVVNEDGSISIYALTKEQGDQILDLINNTKRIVGYDNSIMDIITSETDAYFAGTKTLDETASMIQSRVNLYVAEQS